MKNPRQYKPPIEQRDTNLLVGMAWNYDDYWHPEASQLAKEELKKRGISREYQDKLTSEWKQDMLEREAERKVKLKQNEQEYYKIGQLIIIFFLSPFLVIGKFSYDLSLSELRKENYKIKFQQRRIVLALGLVCFFLTIYLGTRTY